MGPSTRGVHPQSCLVSVSFSWLLLRFCFGFVPWLVLWGLTAREIFALQDQAPVCLDVAPSPRFSFSLSLFFSLSSLFGCFLKRDSSGITG